MADEGLKEKILAWLAEEFDVSTGQLPANAPVEWAVKASVRGARIVVTVQKPRGRDAIVLTLGVGLGPKHREALSNMPDHERVKIMAELVKGLYTMCPDCSIAAQPSLEKPEVIIVTKAIYLDGGLVRGVLLSAARTLANMAVYIMIHVNVSLGLYGQRGGGGEGYML